MQSSYFSATRHPWPCLFFLFPLLVVYEVGVIWVGGIHADAIRNGADHWVRWSLQTFGMNAMLWPPILIVLIFMGWNWLRRDDRPGELFSVWIGMIIESVAFALILWGLARISPHLWSQYVGEESSRPLIELGILQSYGNLMRIGLLISFVGAGIYEELLFRLLLFPIIYFVLSKMGMARVAALAIAMILSSLAFAAAHHIGAYGEPMTAHVMIFRTLAGMYFVLLFHYRGFGIAVGAHAFYDVLVGLAMMS